MGFLEDLANLHSQGALSTPRPPLEINAAPGLSGQTMGGGLPAKRITAYHGTDSEIAVPQIGYGGSRGKVPGEQGSIFFTPNQKLAGSYGKNVHEKQIDLSNSRVFDINALVQNPVFQQEMKRAILQEGTRNPELMKRAQEDPAYMDLLVKRWQKIQEKIDDPKKRANDHGFMRYDSAITSAVISLSRKLGVDVAVIKNMAEGHGKPSDQIVVLNQSAILPEDSK